MKNRIYVRFNSVQNLLVCITLTIVATFLTTKDFSPVVFVLSVIQSYVINQTIAFMLDMDAIDKWFYSVTKLKNRGLSNSIINTLIYATIINTLNTLLASREMVVSRFFHTYPWLVLVGVATGWIFGPLSAKLANNH